MPAQHQPNRDYLWLATAGGLRPGLGPHAFAPYQWQLEAVEPLGVDRFKLDQAVSLLTGFAINAAALPDQSGDESQEDPHW